MKISWRYLQAASKITWHEKRNGMAASVAAAWRRNRKKKSENQIDVAAWRISSSARQRRHGGEKWHHHQSMAACSISKTMYRGDVAALSSAWRWHQAQQHQRVAAISSVAAAASAYGGVASMTGVIACINISRRWHMA